MDEQETTVPIKETTIEAPETETIPVTPEEVTPEVVEVPETSSTASDVAPEDVPVVHEDDGSIGRELDHVVNQ